MRDPRLDQLARVLVTFGARVKGGELVTIVGEPEPFDAVHAVFDAVLDAGGHPSFHPRCERLIESVILRGSEAQVRHVSPFERHRLSHADVLIVLIAPRNTRFLGRADPARAAMWQAARGELMTASLRRGAEGSLRYLCAEVPTPAAAQDAGLSLAHYADLLFRAGMLHRADPVAAWGALREQQARLCERLGRARELRFVSPACAAPSGRALAASDLRVDVSGMTWVNASGEENFPDGEVFSGPRDAEGTIHFNVPSVYKGRAMSGVRLVVRGGRVVEAAADQNEEYLFALLDQDEGARTLGEIALGTNYELREIVNNAFLDEKVGGTFHLALGAGYPATGNTNQSGLHWDIVHDLRPGGAFAGAPGGEVWADGELIQKDGRFTVAGFPGA